MLANLTMYRRATNDKTNRSDTKGSAMNKASQSTLIRSTGVATVAWRILLGLILTAGTVTTLHAQGQIASGTVSGSGSGPFTYNLTFSAEANSLSPVGSVWYAWIPGYFFLPGVPTSASAPAGWTASVFANSVQFFANSPANAIAVGHSLSGFSYVANFTPAQLAGAPNSGLSVAYAGGIETDPGYTFTVQIVQVPEPSTLVLIMAGTTASFLAGRRKPRAV